MLMLGFRACNARSVLLRLALLACVSLTGAAHAAPPPAEPVRDANGAAATAREKLAALQPLVGEWRGRGWIRAPDGQRIEFEQSESVQFELQGELLRIRGIGEYVESGRRSIVHDALALVTWDAAGERYRWQARRAGADWIDSTLSILSPGRFRWQTPPAATQMRFTFEVADGRWRHLGEASRDGVQWIPVLGFELQRVGS